MQCDLIIDGNYILSKNTFTLHKNNILYGSLHRSLENTVSNYRKWYPFSNVYMVSDSREKSWRKDVYNDYKAKRKKDSEIDWQFVYNAYREFKDSLVGVKIMEEANVEGDDWISFIVNKSNSEGRSTIIVSNDYDIKQLVRYELDPLYINVMTNEMMNREKVFFPKNYQLFLNSISKLSNDDIFDLNDNNEFKNLIVQFTNKYEFNEINPIECLVIKLISGDTSDCISSVWSKKGKDGKARGIGEAGAKSLYDKYVEEFGEPSMEDSDLSENIADLICESKKISKTMIDSIKFNINRNIKLIDLRIENLPIEIVNKMETKYGSK